MRWLVALGLLVSLSVSGCAVSEDDPEADETSTSGSATRTGSATRSASLTRTGTGSSTNTSSVPDLPPTANLTATPVNGTAPLNVTFSLSGSDPDGGNITWTLTIDGNATANGTALPSNVTHSFTEAGNYTVVLTVRDASRNATANLTISVEGGAPASGPVREDANVVFNADGTCDAKGETAVAGNLYVHNRGGSSIWIYAEDNGKPGLQVGGADENAAYKACLDPDFLIF